MGSALSGLPHGLLMLIGTAAVLVIYAVLLLIGARLVGRSYSAHTTSHTHHHDREDTSWLPW